MSPKLAESLKIDSLPNIHIYIYIYIYIYGSK